MAAVFSSLREALTAGYYVESRNASGYTVCTRIADAAYGSTKLMRATVVAGAT